MRIIVVGIHTEVGKTVVSAILAQAFNASYWKPVQCGLPADRAWIQEITQKPCFPDGFTLKTPCSPHLAAKKESLLIRATDLIPPPCDGPLIIEGTGGIMAPLNEEETWFDAAIRWKATHWVLVHRHYLGSLNHFFLTTNFLLQQKVPLTGVVFNGDGDFETEEMLLQKIKTRCLGRLKWPTELSQKNLQKLAHQWKPHLW